MRTHGWRGDPPRTDEEARLRIIEATTRCVDRYGPAKTGLTDVAAELGVTRATVYRYFRNTDELLKATSLMAADDFLDRLTQHFTERDDPVDILVEVIAFAIERLPGDRRVGLLIASGRTASMSADLLSPTTIGFARAMLQRLPIDWATAGYTDSDLGELAEFMLRLLHSYLPKPGATDAPEDPRPFLRRWFVPAFTVPAGDPAPAPPRPEVTTCSE